MMDYSSKLRTWIGYLGKHLMRLIHVIKRNSVFFISVTGVLILHLVIAWQPLNHLEGFPLLRGNGPLVDDSYIFFKMSRDLADWFAGCNSSFQLSSGFQPLIALLFIPFFSLFWNYKELPIHLALSLNALLGFFANIFLYLLLRKVCSRSIATFLVSVWIWSPYVMNQSVNGMETTLALLLLLVTLNYYWQINQPTPSGSRSWFILGLFLGIGFWARVDIAMAGIAIALDQAWQSIKDDQHSRFLRLRNIVFCGLTALAVASPWIVFTVASTGNLIPVSGRAINQISSALLDYYHPNHQGFSYMMFGYFKEQFYIYQPMAALSNYKTWQTFISCLSLAGLILAIINRQLRALFRPVWIFQAIMLASYIIFIGGWWHLYRYLYPVYTLILLLHATTLRYLESKFKFRPWVFSMILFLLFMPYSFYYTYQYSDCWSKNVPPRYLSASLFAKDRIPPEAKVGAFQSGCLSYWLDNQVINLDGVTNIEAYVHLKNKTFDDYLDEQQIDYLIDEFFLFKTFDHYLEGQLSKHYTRIARKKEGLLKRAWDEWSIYKRKSGKISSY